MPLLPETLPGSHQGNTSSNNQTDTGLPVTYSVITTIFISIFVIVIIILIVFGNLLVVIAIATDRNLKLIQNWFIASLALADFLLGLIIMPFSLANELMGYWFFGPIWCDLWKSIDVFLCTASILSICLISLDRYWSVTRALEYARQRTSKRAAFMITAVWFLSAVICIPPLIGWKNPLPVSEYPLCLLSDETGYVIYSSMGSFYIPAVIMVFVYFKIYLAAKARARRHGKRKPKPPKVKSSKENITKKNNAVIPPPTVIISKDKIDKDVKNGTPPPSDDESTWPIYQKQPNEKGTPTDYRELDERTKLLAPEDPAVEAKADKRNIEISQPTLSDDSVSNHAVTPKQTETLEKLKSNSQSVKSNESTNLLSVTKKTSLTDTVETNKVSPEVNYVGSCDSEEDSGIQLTTITTTMAADNKTENNQTNGQVKKLSIGDIEKQKRKIAKARERRATLILGLVMAAFILCWCPFFTLYIASSLCNFCIPNVIFNVCFWAGYCNSALNPIIYTIFNRDFRHAFHRIVTGKAFCSR